ncbi:MAG: hypothetical protein FJY98_00020 [Candidatus Liptonbacteria bacterium]|nr:hypothetical protein [Candidatus Liptonbacteria bacterium]
MILSGETIKKYVREGLFEINPFSEKNLKGASYTFTLDSKLLRLRDGQKLLRADKKPDYEEIEISNDGYILKPGEFILGFTKEKLKLNDKFACSLSSRGSCAQIGLDILLGSSFAEPDTNNSQTLEIFNVSGSSIVLFRDMPIVKGIFIPID